MTVHIYLPTMEPAQSEAKRPRLTAPSEPTWITTSHQGPVLPPPQPAAHHHPSLSPFQSHNLYSRQPEPPSHPGHQYPDDRRHHEQDSYPPPPPPPMQDHHRQPPPSPVHAPPYPPIRRESIVKRESGEETPLPQMRRPNSTGNTPEGGLAPHPHGPPPYPGQHPSDPRRPPSFENAAPMPPQSPQVYRPPQQPTFHPPPTPMAQHQYEAPPGYGPPPPVADIYSTVPVASAKRKAQRASQACESCRQLKAKCDESRPCKNCKDKDIKCVYRDLPTKQPDKVSADILEVINALKTQMTHEFGKMHQRMNRLEHAVGPVDPSSELKVESVEDETQGYDQSPVMSAKESLDEQPSSPKPHDFDRQVLLAHETMRQAEKEEIETQPGQPVAPGQPSMPADHTTLAALLLKWKSIEALVQDLVKKEGIQYIEEFPIRQEQQRGVLRVFGRGEGFDQEIRPQVGKYEHSMDQVMTDINDDYSDVASPLPDPTAWGQVGGLSPAGLDIYKGGALNIDGTPDFDRATVKLYVDSFKENVLNLHPIIIPSQLDAMVTIFLDSLPPHSSKPSNRSAAKFVQPGGITSAPDTGTKRKRSPAAEELNPAVAVHKPGYPFRSIHSALVLAVLALGKLSLHKGRIPDFAQDQDVPVHNSPSVRNGVMSSPSQGSPPGLTPAHTSGLPSPKENDRSLPSRRPSLQGLGSAMRGHTMKRNLDVIPGLEYYGLAADIFGSHLGGITLKHVYVALFLGLYHGQLGRVLESWAYISHAGTTLQVILRPSLSRLAGLAKSGQIPETKRDSQLAFAFWTCLQLESDILAELPLPQTGILSFEDVMPYPDLSNQTNDGYSVEVLGSYQAQLWLRKRLNDIHNELYSNNPVPDGRSIEEKIKTHQLFLKESMFRWCPKEFFFSQTDPPASDILSARLRAKYWGSQVIVHRNFIDMILHSESIPKNTFDSPLPPRDQWVMHGIQLEGCIVPPNIDPRALNYARVGINALVESTRAFHGLDPRNRLLVTNIFTTAHAQWGNLLVLAACYKHHVLSQFIKRELLQELFHRTIEYFKLIAHQTSPLRMDLNILIGLGRKLGFHQIDNETRASSSFSSMTSTAHLAMQAQNENHHPGTPVMAPPPHAIP